MIFENSSVPLSAQAGGLAQQSAEKTPSGEHRCGKQMFGSNVLVRCRLESADTRRASKYPPSATIGVSSPTEVLLQSGS